MTETVLQPRIDAECGGTAAPVTRERSVLLYGVLGVVFGIVLIRSEVVSWFRIQEMFRFQGPHMFGIFATALPVAILSVQALLRGGIRTIDGDPIVMPTKPFGRGVRYGAGGILFGLGWALTGACPGPLFALLGSGVGVVAVVIASALAGTWTYGWLEPRLPR